MPPKQKTPKTDCCQEIQHSDHAKELPRLNRVSGQIEGIKRMIEERRYCLEILGQLRAIRAAVHSIEASILEAHLDSCVADAMNAGDEEARKKKIGELKELYRKYNE